MKSFVLPLITACLVVLLSGGLSPGQTSAIDRLSAYLATPRNQRKDLGSQSFAAGKLTRTDAEQAKRLLWDDHVTDIKESRRQEWNDKAITIGNDTLKLLTKTFGTKPANGWKLFISMHGGGGAPAAVNDQQWHNQIKLYHPANSLYVCPRAPTDTWNLWHESHIDPLFVRLIEDAIVLEGVDPNHVYLMGYSAGGDGTYALAPRMADSFAAASMMAGHPNDASPLGLRNLPFAIHVGALDDGYHRNQVAIEWGKKLDELQKNDPQGYVHDVHLHEGRAHWMNLEDAVAIDWMLKYTRDPLPQKIVWKQSGECIHDRFYWLGMSPERAKKGQLLIASRNGQAINIEAADDCKSVSVLLNDAMLDLDQPVTISHNGKELFKGVAPRTIGQMQSTLVDRGDPDLVFSARQTVAIDSAN